MRLLDAALRGLIKRGELTIVDTDGTTRRYGAPDPGRAPVTIRLTDRKVARRFARSPSLAVGEAYMDGGIVFDQGDIQLLIDLVTSNARFEESGVGGTFLRNRWNKLREYLSARNAEARSRRNVAHHYDLGNALYRHFLDDDLQYSCAYYTATDNGLDQAQADKKAHIAAKLCLEPGMRVLDIGCGWGGMALYLNQVAGVDVTGITLSQEQLKLARERAAAAGKSDQVRFELMDYRQAKGCFDRIVSVGMFEHVGARHYAEFFARCRALLAPRGVMLLHTIGRFDRPSAGEPFTDKYIFPGYYLPTLSQIARAGEKAGLVAADVETLRLHYALTLRAWLRRTRAAADELAQLYDARFVRMWEYYLAGAISMFENGSSCVFQLQYLRDRQATPITRDYMGTTEQSYRAATQNLPPPTQAVDQTRTRLSLSS